MLKPAAILFDLDGTLVDTYDLILASQRYSTQSVLGITIPDERLMATVGKPLEDQMCDYTDDPTVVEKLCSVYREHNDIVHDQYIKCFMGVGETLEKLAASGIRMGVVTSKRQEPARQALDDFDLAKYMEIIVGGHDTKNHKPHPEPILKGCELMGVRPPNAVYVGDSPFDIQAGNSAGCETIAVTWGMFSKEKLLAENPTYVAHTFEELLGILI